MKKHFGLVALLAGAVFMLGIVACNNNPEPEPAQKEEPVKGFALKTGFEINDIFRNDEKLNAVDATAFAKATEPPAQATFYLDINNKDVPVWYDEANTTIYYYVAPGNKLFLNEDSARMFKGSSTDKSKFISIDTSEFNTSNVTKMQYMFDHCENLKTIDVSHFDTSKVTNMVNMFAYCSALESVDVSQFNTSNVESMTSMFYKCQSLKSIDVSNFDTKNVTNMWGMFSSCSKLENMDLSSFDIKKVTDMEYMLQSCVELKKIIVKPSTDWSSSETKSSGMFYGCTNLAGGNGTVFDSTKTDKTYARVDSADAPGYFTAKN